MTFLSPLASLLAAAVLVPALLVLYVLKLRRRELLVSSVMHWGASGEDREANVPWQRLRPSLLLLVQLLALLSLLGALARPVLSGHESDASRVVIVLDRSASMSARDMEDGRSRLEHARERGRAIARSAAARGSEVVVIGWAVRATVAAVSRGDARAAAEAIDGLQATDQPADAMALAGTLAALLRVDGSDASDDAGPAGAPGTDDGPSAGGAAARVVILSDGGNLPGGDEQGPARAALASALDRALGVSYERVAPLADAAEQGSGESVGAGANVGVVALAARRDAEDPASIRVLARLASGVAMDRPFALELWHDDSVIDRRSVRLNAGAESNGHGAPAMLDVVLRASIPQGGVLSVRVVDRDALEADNVASLVLRPAARPSVVLVVPDGELDGAGDVRGGSWLVHDVLRELGLRSLVVRSATQHRGIVERGEGGAADLVVYDRVEAPPRPTTASIVLGRDLGVEPTAEVGDAQPRAQTVLVWDRAHALLRDTPMDGAAGMCWPVRAERAGFRSIVLAEGSAGAMMVLHEGAGIRHLVLGLDPTTSRWTLDVGFAVLLAGAVEHVTRTGQADPGQSWTTAEPAWLAPSEGDALGSDAVDRPAFDAELERIERLGQRAGSERVRARWESDGTVLVGVIERAGLYRWSRAGSTALVAVNLLSEPETLLRSPERVWLARESATSASRTDVERELWPWLVAIALVLLAIEWLLWLRR